VKRVKSGCKNNLFFQVTISGLFLLNFKWGEEEYLFSGWFVLLEEWNKIRDRAFSGKVVTLVGEGEVNQT
jgi:hypothetical protein